MEIPAGYTHRPLAPSDAAGVVAVMAAEQLASLGSVMIEEADIVADWQRPSFDLAASTVGVLHGETLVGYAEVSDGDHGDAAVHPDHHGRGIGTALAQWMQAKAREQGSSVVGMPVPGDSPGDRLLAALGYRVRWTSWILELPDGVEIASRSLPVGYTLREATPEDYPAVWTVNEDAFLEWSVRERRPFDDWLAAVPGRPGFAPWNLKVVVDPAGDIVAMALIVLAAEGTEGYVDMLATRADQRGRGLAQALLVDSFAAARAHGASRSALSTDSRTGALGLYEKVGMVVSSSWVNRGIDV